MSEPDHIEVDLRCLCGAHQRRLLDAEAPAKSTLAEIVCQACGATGKSKISAPPPEEPPEHPPHPEEP